MFYSLLLLILIMVLLTGDLKTLLNNLINKMLITRCVYEGLDHKLFLAGSTRKNFDKISIQVDALHTHPEECRQQEVLNKSCNRLTHMS